MNTHRNHRNILLVLHACTPNAHKCTAHLFMHQQERSAKHRERERGRERERDGKERKEVSTVEFQISRNRCCMGESTGDGLSGRHSRAIFTSSFGILATAARLQGTRKGLQLHRKGKGWGAERTVAMMSNLETRFSLLSACSIQESFSFLNPSLCPYTLEPRILPISKTV